MEVEYEQREGKVGWSHLLGRDWRTALLEMAVMIEGSGSSSPFKAGDEHQNPCMVKKGSRGTTGSSLAFQMGWNTVIKSFQREDFHVFPAFDRQPAQKKPV